MCCCRAEFLLLWERGFYSALAVIGVLRMLEFLQKPITPMNQQCQWGKKVVHYQQGLIIILHYMLHNAKQESFCVNDNIYFKRLPHHPLPPPYNFPPSHFSVMADFLSRGRALRVSAAPARYAPSSNPAQSSLLRLAWPSAFSRLPLLPKVTFSRK